MNGMLVSLQDSYIGILIPTVDAESLVKLMPKTEPLCTSTKLNLRDRVLGKVEKNSFIALPGKGGHRGLMPSKLCLHLEGIIRSEWSACGHSPD